MLFNDSEAQRLEYQKVGQEFQPSEEDKNYQFVLKQIDSDPNKKEKITNMTRVMVSQGEEYIVYHHIWEGVNPIGSYCRTTQTNVGIYGKFEPIFEKYINEDNTFGQRLISKNTVISYFIPFTKEKAKELHKLCNDSFARANQKTAYYVMPEGGTKISVPNYEDWLDGEFNDLYQNGKITALAVKPKAH